MDAHNFFYLSDQRGITNLFHYNSLSGIYSQVTNFNSSIKDFDVNFDNRLMATVLTQKLRENIFIDRQFNFDKQVFTPVTRRKEVLQAKVFIERKKKEPTKATSLKDLINSRMREKADTTETKQEQQPVEMNKDTVKIAKKANSEISTDNYSFEEEPAKKEQKDNFQSEVKPTLKPANKTISTDDYVFEDDAVKQNQQPNETFLTRY